MLRRVVWRVDRVLWWVLSVGGSALLSVMVVLTVTQVLMRYVFRAPLIWSDELATYSFIWTSMIGAAIAVQARGHYGLELLVTALPGLARRLIQRIVHAACCALCAIIAVLSWPFALEATNTMAALPITMTCFYAALPFGFGAMALHYAIHTVTGEAEPQPEGPTPHPLPRAEMEKYTEPWARPPS
jgi:TRAP-type C4-dicarboxylate transport system permease small subunit